MNYVLAILLLLGSPQSKNIDRHELFCLSNAIYNESRGEPILGQVAVAHVVLNRLKSPLFPKTICAVVYQYKQFSDIEQSIPDFHSKEWQTAKQVAKLSYLGILASPIKGAKWFFAPDKVKKPKRWPKTYVATIGGHDFYDADRL